MPFVYLEFADCDIIASSFIIKYPVSAMYNIAKDKPMWSYELIADGYKYQSKFMTYDEAIKHREATKSKILSQLKGETDAGNQEAENYSEALGVDAENDTSSDKPAKRKKRQ